MSKIKQIRLEAVSDYIQIRPDKPKGGDFNVGDTYIDETGIVERVGPACSEWVQKLFDKRVLFNAWACDQKTIQGQKYYFATESANAIVAIL